VSPATALDGGGPDTGRGEDSSSPPDSGGQDSSARDSAAQDSSSGSDAGTPTNHRPDDSQCTQPAPAGDCTNGGGGGGGECSADNQCTTGTNGRCVNDGPLPGCRCTYDTCTTDTSCPAGQLCACHGSAYNSSGNTCIPGNCRVDSDCGAHGYCSPTSGASSCGGVTGYYCHTPADTCVNDSDCSGQGFDICAWSTGDARWECQMGGVCG
jgi:hypothetical protein